MAVFRVLIDEFGCGNSEQENSQLYRNLLMELGMPTDLDHYIEIAAEPSFAYVNLFSWLAARTPAEKYFLGAYAYFESSVLSAFQSFATAAERLGIHNRRYYTEHLYEDERPIDLPKIWTGALLTTATVAEATEAAVTKARRAP